MFMHFYSVKTKPIGFNVFYSGSYNLGQNKMEQLTPFLLLILKRDVNLVLVANLLYQIYYQLVVTFKQSLTYLLTYLLTY